MIKTRIAGAGILLAVGSTAFAGSVSGTVGLVSDYDFRGLTQTLNDPAFQLGLTYTADSGLYLGTWGSNVDFQGDGATYANSDLDRPSTEIDLFAGYSGGDKDKTLGYDVGLIYYSYPNAGAINFTEAYAGVSKGPVSAKVWYSWDFSGSGISETYFEGNVAVPLTEGFNFTAHAGYSDSDYFLGGNYFDWSAGVGYDVSNLSLFIKYADGSDLKVAPGAPRYLGRFVFGVSTTLPWGK